MISNSLALVALVAIAGFSSAVRQSDPKPPNARGRQDSLRLSGPTAIRHHAYYPPLSRVQLASLSDVAMRGVVLSREQEALAGGMVVSKYTVSVIDSWHGPTSTQETIQVIGGRTDTAWVLNDSDPTLVPGKDYVFYCERTAAGHLLLSAGFQSALPVERTAEASHRVLDNGAWEALSRVRAEDTAHIARAAQRSKEESR
ncbi:MAG: hypothetical protein AB7I19_17465 [Planctomycetota bacterium]